jgi:copper chaperone CopZ
MCARRVEKSLNKIDGVRASVEFSTRAATIEADSAVSVSDLCDAVHQAGYGAKQRDEDAGTDVPVVRRKPGVLRTVIAAATLLARWLMLPFHR